MDRLETTALFKCLLICATISPVVFAITLPNQATSKPHHIKLTTSTAEPPGGSVLTPSSTASKEEDGVAEYRHVNRHSGTTCILLKTDAVVEVNYLMHNLPEQADSFIPSTKAEANVDGDCNEDESSLKITWPGYDLVLYFAKTPGGERWYIRNVELTVNSDLPKFRSLNTHGKPIKLYHKQMLIPTPIGKSYVCQEVDIDLEADTDDRPPPGLRGSLLLRSLQLQPFMYKGENFESSYECKPQKSFRDETAPIAVGSTLAIAVLMTVTGYGIFRYFKIKNVQYNTME